MFESCITRTCSCISCVILKITKIIQIPNWLPWKEGRRDRPRAGSLSCLYSVSCWLGSGHSVALSCLSSGPWSLLARMAGHTLLFHGPVWKSAACRTGMPREGGPAPLYVLTPCLKTRQLPIHSHNLAEYFRINHEYGSYIL